MGEKLGFIGLGIMGGHMARHVSEKYDCMVFDIDPKRTAAVENAKKAESVQQVGEYADIILLSLPSSGIVEDVITGEKGLIHVVEKGKAIIDTSTTEPTVTRRIAEELQKKGIDFMDTPVSGGEGGARDASLAIMAGGPQEIFDKYKPYLEVMGKSVVRVGDIGAGGVAKLVNNMIVGATFSIIAEGFALGQYNGLDPQVLYEAIRGGWAGSAVMEVAAPGIIERNFKPGGSVDIIFKDIGYALSLARSGNVPTPITSTVDDIFKAARASGRGGFAQQGIIELWEDLLNTKERKQP